MKRLDSSSQKTHVIVFRHCVRSTKSKVQLYLKNSDKSTRHDIQDFTASPMPDWNVPPDWCTPEGIKTIKRSGQYLMQEILYSDEIKQDIGNEKWKVNFDVVSDTAYRDVDTALALSLGISEAAAESKDYVEPTGLLNLRYDPLLFKPFEAIKHKFDAEKSEKIEEPKCTPKFSGQGKAEDLKKRFKRVPKPKPDLDKTLELIEKLGGLGPAGKLSSYTNEPEKSVNDLKFYRDETFEGPINILKLMGQIVFYSRAGGIKPPFLPNATVEDVYQILSWVHYARSVVSVDNAKAALKGAILADTIIKELGKNIDSDNESENYDASVKILVGHDTDLDSVATAFGLRWKLFPPFYQDSSGEYIPTPPGSGIHFAYDRGTGGLEMSFIYPNMVTGTGDSMKYNKTGILESVPILFSKDLRKDPMASLIQGTKSSHLISLDSELSSVEILSKRAKSSLERFPEASECYSNLTKTHTYTSNNKIPIADDSTSSPFFLETKLYTFSVFALCLALLYKKSHIKRKIWNTN